MFGKPEICPLCNGKGYKLKKINNQFKKTVCKCQKEMVNLDEISEMSEDILYKYIPNELYHEDISITKLKENKVIGSEWEVEFSKYINFVSKFPTSLAIGKMPTKSYFVVAPPNFGKKFFIYNCIKKTLMGGKTPTELLDTAELYTLYSQKEYKQLKDYFLNHDIVFMTVGNSPNMNDVIVLKHMMDLADRFGKPIIMISRISVPYFLNFDANLIDDLGVKRGYKHNYGILELAGFSNDFMKDYFTDNSKKVRKLLRGNKYEYEERTSKLSMEDEDDILSKFTKKTLNEDLDEDDAEIDSLLED